MQELIYYRPDRTEKSLMCGGAGSREFGIADIAHYEVIVRPAHCADCRRDLKKQKKIARKNGKGWVFEDQLYKWDDMMKLMWEFKDARGL